MVLSFAFYYKDVSKASQNIKEVSMSEFVTNLENNKVKEVSIEGTVITGKIGEDKFIYCYAPSISEVLLLDQQYFFPLMQEHDFCGEFESKTEAAEGMLPWQKARLRAEAPQTRNVAVSARTDD